MGSRKRKANSRKKPSRKPAKPAAANRAALAPKVRVRMYRQGLGDCFLITFNPGPNEKHMLIDCGTLGSTPGIKMANVVTHIRETTKDHIHVVVATHEHKDHVSGFGSYEEEFRKITVDHVWMAWTENPEDEDAQKLERHRDDLKVAAFQAAKALQAIEKEQLGLDVVVDGSVTEAVNDILGFDGFGLDDDLAKTIDAAMDFVRKELGKETHYLEPGELREESWLPGFRFYVLGPPRSRDAIHETGDHGSEELYGVTAGFRSGAMKASGHSSSPHSDEGHMPFDIRFRLEDADPILADSLRNYRDPAVAWRRIDGDWLHAAADLALQLDSLTNNTSLALAIERISDGKILLFPADAQQGHWLSWHEVKWKEGASSDLSAAKLLRQTVFYKVGHHGSHNATAKGKGLELMERKEDLVAFIPVDRAIALSRNPKGSWEMPARELYRTLLEKCNGRVVRADIGWAADAQTAEDKTIEKQFIDLASSADWTKYKTQQTKTKVDIQDLYIDFTLE